MNWINIEIDKPQHSKEYIVWDKVNNRYLVAKYDLDNGLWYMFIGTGMVTLCEVEYYFEPFKKQ